MKKLTVFLITSIFAVNIFAEITLPTISPEIQELANQSAQQKQDARNMAIKIKKPIIDNDLKTKIQKLINNNKKLVIKQQPLVQDLTNKTINNKEWKAKQQNIINQVYKTTGIGIKKPKENQEISGKRLYFFISSSMPKDKVRRYVRQLSKYPQAQILLQGFIGGAKKMQPTIKYIKSIISKDETCLDFTCSNYKVAVNIDPVLFERYNITKVPALVSIDDISGTSYCSEGNADLVTVSGVKTFIGVAPLKYMLRELGLDNE